MLTATSPARLGPPGGPKLAGTNPLAIGIPSSDGEPVVVDVSMGAVTWGDVLAGLAAEEQLVPFGGDQWHKAFALAVGLQLLVDSLVAEPGHGAVLLVARPEADPVPLMRAHGRRACRDFLANAADARATAAATSMTPKPRSGVHAPCPDAVSFRIFAT